MKKNLDTDINSNIILWYDFHKNSKILYYGEKSESIKKKLRENNNIVREFNENCKENISEYDYIVILKKVLDIKVLESIFKQVNNDAIILLAYDNAFGISRFLTYDFKNRVHSLDVNYEEYISIDKLNLLIKKYRFKNINKYLPFPNWKQSDFLISSECKMTNDKLEKYFYRYNNKDLAVLSDEITELKKIYDNNNILFYQILNSYFLEISKNKLINDINYVSFNNYRKEKYNIITIIKGNVVEKMTNSQDSQEHINCMIDNLKYFERYKFNILDYAENGKFYSRYIRNKKTLDLTLAKNYQDTEYIVTMFELLRKELNKNSRPYKTIKKINPKFKIMDNYTLEKFNILEYGFYDLIPKNCFYINNKFYFFDQEWMEKNIPTEFILYRAVINSYDLIRKIDANIIFERLGILEYVDNFEKIDCLLRDGIIDDENKKIIINQHPKLYELLYDKMILEKENEDLKENNLKQDKYIKFLEEKIKKEEKSDE